MEKLGTAAYRAVVVSGKAGITDIHGGQSSMSLRGIGGPGIREPFLVKEHYFLAGCAVGGQAV